MAAENDLPGPLELWGLLRDFDRLTERKARLAACAACARVGTLLEMIGLTECLAAAEAVADNVSAETVLKPHYQKAAALVPRTEPMPLRYAAIAAKAVTSVRIIYTASDAIEGAACAEQELLTVRTTQNNRVVSEQYARLLLDIFGDPMRVPSFQPNWRSSNSVGLARAIYDDRAFDRLPILADALMDAGCDDEQILAHCRSEGPHVRGCWVVDLVLGKQ
jgi:hypothetical protein